MCKKNCFFACTFFLYIVKVKNYYNVIPFPPSPSAQNTDFTVMSACCRQVAVDLKRDAMKTYKKKVSSLNYFFMDYHEVFLYVHIFFCKYKSGMVGICFFFLYAKPCFLGIYFKIKFLLYFFLFLHSDEERKNIPKIWTTQQVFVVVILLIVK